LSVREPHHLAHQILFLGGDDVRRAGVEKGLLLSPGTGGRDRRGADQPGDLDRGKANAAGSPLG
jgi:hypothetical protein